MSLSLLHCVTRGCIVSTLTWRGTHNPAPNASISRQNNRTAHQRRSQLAGSSSRWRTSDFNLTNSFATSSLLRCERMRNTVQPVSSRCTRFPSEHQHAQLPFSMMSRSCMTVTPIRRSSRAMQKSLAQMCSS